MKSAALFLSVFSCIAIIAPPKMALAAATYCNPALTNCVNETCPTDAIGTTTLDKDKTSVIACLADSAGSTTAHWKSTTSEGTSPAGTLCGAVFWEAHYSRGCNNVQSMATCLGQPLMHMATCGVVSCPSGYSPAQTAYSWGDDGGGKYYYYSYSCAKQ